MTRNSTLIVTILLLMLTAYSHAQIRYIVTAESGLTIRASPNSNGEKLGKLPYGTYVEIVKKTTNTQVIRDNGKPVKGTWVKIKIENRSYFISNEKFGYVFNGYLKKRSESIKDIADEVYKHSELKEFSINAEMEPFFIRGDFFGDKVNDLVVLLEDTNDETKIAFINYGKTTKVYILGNEDDPFKMSSYNWVSIFEKVKKGEPLWSNYDDDYIDFKDVPESKKIKLNYNAIYLHASESCGGGYIFWKDEKFNWLQQE